jgi:hypothetical protein
MRGGDFWSLRRARVAAEEKAEAEKQAARLRAEEETREAERTDEEILAELDLPDPEEMTSPDQVKALLRTAAPQRLKRRALRRLWRLNPVLANLDGLNDYDDDYTDAATAGEVVKTTYRVGKGLLKHIEAQEEARAAKAAALAEGAPEPETAEPEPTLAETPATTIRPPAEERATDAQRARTAEPETAAAPAAQSAAAPDADADAAPIRTAPRRMTFTFQAT